MHSKGPCEFAIPHRRRDSRDYIACDGILHIEQISHIAGVPIRADDIASCGIHQLGGNTQARVGPAYAAAQYVSHAEITSNRTRVDILASIRETGTAPD